MLAPHPHAAIVNSVIGKPYLRGGSGPDAFDCYGLTRYLQMACAHRDMPAFRMPDEAGRPAIAAMVAQHPERGNWIEVKRPEPLCIVTMAKVEMGYHMGTWFDLDGGLVVHCIGTEEERGAPSGPGVVADTLSELRASHWRAFKYLVPRS